MNVDAIFQVRLGSTRLPRKILKPLLGRPLLKHVIDRVKAAKTVGRIIITTTEQPEDDELVKFAKDRGLLVSRGPVDSVLEQYYRAAKKFGSDVIVRITPDDPFKDPEVIDRLVTEFLDNHPNYDYVSNTLEPTYPEGIDTEVFSFNAIERAFKEATKPSEHEHATPYIWTHPELFKLKNLKHDRDLSKLRWTVDYDRDFRFAEEIYRRLYPKKKIFLMADILQLLEREPELSRMNSDIPYHEGYTKSLEKDKLAKENNHE